MVSFVKRFLFASILNDLINGWASQTNLIVITYDNNTKQNKIDSFRIIYFPKTWQLFSSIFFFCLWWFYRLFFFLFFEQLIKPDYFFLLPHTELATITTTNFIIIIYNDVVDHVSSSSSSLSLSLVVATIVLQLDLFTIGHNNIHHCR